MRSPSSAERAQTVAKITLAALRGLAEPGASVRRDRTILNGRSLSIQQTIDALAAQPKPVTCRVTIQSDVLAITATEITDAEELRHWQAVIDLSAPDSEQMRHDFARGQAFAMLVDDDNESFIVDDATFTQWERQYDIPGLSYAITPVSNVSRMNEAAIVRFSPRGNKLRVRIDFQEGQ